MTAAKELARRKLSVNARHKISLWRVRGRMVWPPMGMMPNVLVIGAQRAGTSSIYRYLGSHPDVSPSLRKEVEYFSTRMSMGERWYRAHFPLVGRPRVAFEATPDYLLHPKAADRASDHIPDLKAVVMLRDPVTRAFSQYGHQRRLGKEPMSFIEALEAEPTRIGSDLDRLSEDIDYPGIGVRIHGYMERGRYAPQLQRWVDAIGWDRIHVIRTEDLWADPAGTYTTLLDFLGLSHVMPASLGENFSYVRDTPKPEKAMPPEAEVYLKEHLAAEVAAIESLLGHSLW